MLSVVRIEVPGGNVNSATKKLEVSVGKKICRDELVELHAREKPNDSYGDAEHGVTEDRQDYAPVESVEARVERLLDCFRLQEADAEEGDHRERQDPRDQKGDRHDREQHSGVFTHSRFREPDRQERRRCGQ